MADSDINKYTIEFLSFNWLITVACVVGLIFLVILVGRKISERKKLAYAKFLSVIMISFFSYKSYFLVLYRQVGIKQRITNSFMFY